MLRIDAERCHKNLQVSYEITIKMLALVVFHHQMISSADKGFGSKSGCQTETTCSSSIRARYLGSYQGTPRTGNVASHNSQGPEQFTFNNISASTKTLNSVLGSHAMAIKVTFLDRDEILGALVRALAVQAAGFQVVGGMNAEYLKQKGFYLFQLSQPQADRFKSLVKSYIPDRLQELIQITDD
jgi:hypothetical protein